MKIFISNPIKNKNLLQSLNDILELFELNFLIADL